MQPNSVIDSLVQAQIEPTTTPLPPTTTDLPTTNAEISTTDEPATTSTEPPLSTSTIQPSPTPAAAPPDDDTSTSTPAASPITEPPEDTSPPMSPFQVAASTAPFGHYDYGKSVWGQLFYLRSRGESYCIASDYDTLNLRRETAYNLTEQATLTSAQKAGDDVFLLNFLIVPMGGCVAAKKAAVAAIESKAIDVLIIYAPDTTEAYEYTGNETDGRVRSVTVNATVDGFRHFTAFDDGYGSTLSLPTVLVPYREGRILFDAARDVSSKILGDPNAVVVDKSSIVVELSFLRDRPMYDTAKLDVWLTSGSPEAAHFLKPFSDAMLYLRGLVAVEFHYQIQRGDKSNELTVQDYCWSFTGGKTSLEYCSADPDAHGPITGAEVVEEDLRRLCLFDRSNPVAAAPVPARTFAVEPPRNITAPDEGEKAEEDYPRDLHPFPETFWRYLKAVTTHCPLSADPTAFTEVAAVTAEDVDDEAALVFPYFSEGCNSEMLAENAIFIAAEVKTCMADTGTGGGEELLRRQRDDRNSTNWRASVVISGPGIRYGNALGGEGLDDPAPFAVAINGWRYTGPVTPEGVTRALCATLAGPWPKECDHAIYGVEEEEEEEEDEGPLQLEVSRDDSLIIIGVFVGLLVVGVGIYFWLFRTSAPPHPLPEVEELFDDLGITQRHIFDMYKHFVRIHQLETGKRLHVGWITEVPTKGIIHVVRSHRDAVDKIVEALFDLAGAGRETTWDVYLYTTLMFASLSFMELAQFMFYTILKISRSWTVHYIGPQQLNTFYQAYENHSVESFDAAWIDFTLEPYERFYLVDFVELCHRYPAMLSVAVFLQREIRHVCPCLLFWEDWQRVETLNRHIGIGFFRIDQSHVNLRASQGFTPACDILVAQSPLAKFSRAVKTGATPEARRYAPQAPPDIPGVPSPSSSSASSSHGEAEAAEEKKRPSVVTAAAVLATKGKRPADTLGVQPGKLSDLLRQRRKSSRKASYAPSAAAAAQQETPDAAAAAAPPMAALFGRAMHRRSSVRSSVASPLSPFVPAPAPAPGPTPTPLHVAADVASDQQMALADRGSKKGILITSRQQQQQPEADISPSRRNIAFSDDRTQDASPAAQRDKSPSSWGRMATRLPKTGSSRLAVRAGKSRSESSSSSASSGKSSASVGAAGKDTLSKLKIVSRMNDMMMVRSWRQQDQQPFEYDKMLMHATKQPGIIHKADEGEETV
ncbi:unnamed protein product [Vitrella brassicaformis CCMP3155]|uniref:Uncharacterized protein n=1 Tax=Vitrella brassicaformis (strain CCMP3155) TaxID=1169540 RepID=A0A0G4GYE8_VITBC|nr:unnamed protein product [Vitrella brassicaformis CCMP3155]|eukprot:CEM36161.1 unnamed protein product [Vitrella brassicaformis CCMP3155]